MQRLFAHNVAVVNSSVLIHLEGVVDYVSLAVKRPLGGFETALAFPIYGHGRGHLGTNRLCFASLAAGVRHLASGRCNDRTAAAVDECQMWPRTVAAHVIELSLPPLPPCAENG